MVSVTTAPVSVGDLRMPQAWFLHGTWFLQGCLVELDNTLWMYRRLECPMGSSVILEREDMEDPAKPWLCLAPSLPLRAA